MLVVHFDFKCLFQNLFRDQIVFLGFLELFALPSTLFDEPAILFNLNKGFFCVQALHKVDVGL